MNQFRLSKYSPALRGVSGAFRATDWTSVSDIGGVWGGSTLTAETYVRVEDAFAETLLLAHRAAGAPALIAREVERSSEPTMIGGRQSSSLDQEGIVPSAEIDGVIRACLREELWCRLESDAGFWIHFGYDFYVYFCTPVDANGVQVAKGLYLEALRSPYVLPQDGLG